LLNSNSSSFLTIGAVKLILEPIFEADFQPGSFGYRPKKSAHTAIQRVSKAILEGKTYVIDFDLRSYFDTVRHHIVLEKVARRIDDDAVLWLLKLLLDATGKQGVPQGGVISPLLSNLYLNEVDQMLERAKDVTRRERWTAVEYARFADDLVILVGFASAPAMATAGGGETATGRVSQTASGGE
jgi:RNA-directed DNA polymerase